MTTVYARFGRLLLVAVALLSGPTASVAQPAPLAGLDAWVDAEIQRWQIPGLAIAIVKDDSVVYARGFGVRRLGEAARVDENTLFGVACSSSSVRATRPTSTACSTLN